MSANAKFNALYYGPQYAVYVLAWWLTGHVWIGFVVSLLTMPVAWLAATLLWGDERRAERAAKAASR